MDWLFLSPHYDDIALSCAGLVWDLAARRGRVRIVTVCAGEVPDGPLSAFAESLHARWETGSQAVARRRSEDIAACAAMHAAYEHLDLPDCIYRAGPDHFYASEEAIFGEVHPQEEALVQRLAAELRSLLAGPQTQVVCPLTLGGHVDHRLTRRAAEQMGLPLWYYPDYPYVLTQADQLERLAEAGWQRQVFPVSAQGLAQWQEAVAAHTSQISTFWADLPGMRAAIADYAQQFGCTLWKKQ